MEQCLLSDVDKVGLNCYIGDAHITTCVEGADVLCTHLMPVK